jgi:diacylglycerol kinase
MSEQDVPGEMMQTGQPEPPPVPGQPRRPPTLHEKLTPQGAPKPARAAFLQSFVYAFNGLSYAVRTQRNGRVHLVIAILAIGMGLWLGISPIEWGLVFVAITGVFIAEMLNTVVEACVDLATQEYHPLAKVAKDVAAGTVLLNAVLSIIIGLFVFGPHLFPMIARLLHL